MKKDVAKLLQKCEKCKKFLSVMNMPSTKLSSIFSPHPFAQWGIDLRGPFPLAIGYKKFIDVVITYFTKWVEAEPSTAIMNHKIIDFV